VVTDIAAEIRSILVLHLGADEARLTDDARLAEDLGADSLDVVEIVMSCEERFAIDVPNRVATSLATVGETVRFIEAEVAGTAGPHPDRRPVGPRLAFR
jgi:acyl carrier protein